MFDWLLNIYFLLMPLATMGSVWYITSKQKKDKEEEKITMIKLNSMVTLTIKDEPFIGQVVEIRDNIALVMLYENMHYHANVKELTLFSQPQNPEQKRKA